MVLNSISKSGGTRSHYSRLPVDTADAAPMPAGYRQGYPSAIRRRSDGFGCPRHLPGCRPPVRRAMGSLPGRGLPRRGCSDGAGRCQDGRRGGGGRSPRRSEVSAVLVAVRSIRVAARKAGKRRIPGGPPKNLVVCSRRAGSRTGSMRSITASIRLKIAVFAPMPSASDRTATAAKAGLRRSVRTAYRRSWNRSPIQRTPRAPLRLFRLNAGGDVIPDLLFQMEADLRVDLRMQARLRAVSPGQHIIYPAVFASAHDT